MNYYGGFSPRPSFSRGFSTNTAVKRLIIINIAVFFLTVILFLAGGYEPFIKLFAVVPRLISSRFFLWQFFTYMFLHSLNPWHIIINMLILYFLGRMVESTIGKKGFLKLYFTAGLGAGLIHFLAGTNSTVPMIGASGAVFGVMMAFAMIAPEQPITLLLFFILPVTIKAKYLVLGAIFLVTMSIITMSGAQTGVADWAHLGGLFFGYLFMRIKYRLPLPFGTLFRPKLNIRAKLHQRKESKYEPIDTETFISEEIDPILEKISSHGIHSLTRKERRTLKRAHSQMKKPRPHR